MYTSHEEAEEAIGVDELVEEFPKWQKAPSMVIISAAAVSAGSAMAQACATLRPCVPALTGTDLYTKLGPGEGRVQNIQILFVNGKSVINCVSNGKY